MSPEHNDGPVYDPLRGRPLSPREAEIMDLLCQGYLSKEIAYRLKISKLTVRFHLVTVFRKLNAANRVQAALIYYKTSRTSKKAPRMVKARTLAPGRYLATPGTTITY
jgi:DNA-binding NarL/FixJ family response regulator